MKRLINFKHMTWFRKRYLQCIYKQIKERNQFFSCHVVCIYSLFICWKNLKEVEENMNSSYLRQLNDYDCNCVWFKGRENRLKFLQECLNKF